MSVVTRTRRLQDTNFQPGQLLSLPLPKDMVARRLLLVLTGSLTYTIGAGSPAAPRESTVDTLINMFLVQVNGRVVKAVRPHMAHMQEILARGQEGERKSSAAASAATNNNPTADGGFAWGTTGQYTTVREAVELSFEMNLATKNETATWLDLRGVSSAECKMGNTSQYTSLDTAGATLSAFTSTFLIEAYMEEVLGVQPNYANPLDFRQIVGNDSWAAAVTDRSYDLNVGNRIAGIALYVKNGASPSVPSDNMLTDIKIMTGGDIVKQGTFLGFQAEMRQLYGANAPRSSNVSRLDGFVYIPLLSNAKDLSTAYDATNLKSLKLVFSSRSGETYSATMNVEQHEVVKVSR